MLQLIRTLFHRYLRRQLICAAVRANFWFVVYLQQPHNDLTRQDIHLLNKNHFFNGYFLGSSMLSNFKLKSWSVFLVEGYLINEQVRALRCEDCKSNTEILASNYHNPNLLLYGCRESKCKHHLLRLDLTDEISKAAFHGANTPVRKEICCQTTPSTVSA
jgi:hypothetical protein